MTQTQEWVHTIEKVLRTRHKIRSDMTTLYGRYALSGKVPRLANAWKVYRIVSGDSSLYTATQCLESRWIKQKRGGYVQLLVGELKMRRTQPVSNYSRAQLILLRSPHHPYHGPMYKFIYQYIQLSHTYARYLHTNTSVYVYTCIIHLLF